MFQLNDTIHHNFPWLSKDDYDYISQAHRNDSLRIICLGIVSAPKGVDTTKRFITTKETINCPQHRMFVDERFVKGRMLSQKLGTELNHLGMSALSLMSVDEKSAMTDVYMTMAFYGAYLAKKLRGDNTNCRVLLGTVIHTPQGAKVLHDLTLTPVQR